MKRIILLTLAIFFVITSSAAALEFEFNLKSGMNMKTAEATFMKYYKNKWPDDNPTIKRDKGFILFTETVHASSPDKHSYSVYLRFHKDRLFSIEIEKIGKDREHITDHYEDACAMINKTNELLKKTGGLHKSRLYKHGNGYVNVSLYGYAQEEDGSLSMDFFAPHNTFDTTVTYIDVTLAPQKIRDLYEPKGGTYISIKKLPLPIVKNGVLVVPGNLKLGMKEKDAEQLLKKAGIKLDGDSYYVYQTINGKKVKMVYGFDFYSEILYRVRFDSIYSDEDYFPVNRKTYDELITHYKSQRPASRFSKEEEGKDSYDLSFMANSQNRIKVWMSAGIFQHDGAIVMRYGFQMFFDYTLYEQGKVNVTGDARIKSHERGNGFSQIIVGGTAQTGDHFYFTVNGDSSTGQYFNPDTEMELVHWYDEKPTLEIILYQNGVEIDRLTSTK